MLSRHLRRAAVPGAVLTSLLLAACGSAAPGGSPRVGVTAGDGTCALSATDVPAGVVTFAVANTGSAVAEFYVYAADGTTILSEVENVGPGVSRDLVVELPEGSVVTACKPGDGVEGIRTEVTVSASGASEAASTSPELAAAVEQYRAFVAEESAALLAGTRAFVAAVASGDVDAAKALYPTTRVHWERIEPVAESFADLDAAMDAREGDVEPGAEWTGWHVLEKALWVEGSTSGMTAVAEQLLADTEELVDRIGAIAITPSLLGNGAAGLLQEVATGKVTGEEERYSRTDLWDFRANVDGARAAFDALLPALQAADPDLAVTVQARFEALDAALDQHRVGDGWVLYDELSEAEVRELADAVDALAEPLSTVTAAVVRA